jgi:hypothetical protein
MTFIYKPAIYFVDAAHAEPNDRLVVELYGAGETVTFKYVPGTPEVPHDRFVIISEDTTPSVIDEAVDYYNGLPVMAGNRKVTADRLEVAFYAFEIKHLDQRPQPEVDKPLFLRVRKKIDYYFMPSFAPGNQKPKLVKSVVITTVD